MSDKASDDGVVNPGEQTIARIPSSNSQGNSGGENDRASAPEVEPSTVDARVRAQVLTSPTTVFPLGERLKKLQRHPVMLFGTTASGKSTILMSFISNLRQNPEVSIRLGEPIYPEGHPRREEAHNFALDLSERRAENFIRGRKLLTTTEVSYPLFIPIDVQRTRDERPVKFAFLEGKGEWYEPSGNSVGTIYRDFLEEVTDVLKYYDEPISAIFVAPCSRMDDEQRMRENDIALMGALNAYQKHRSRIEDDSLLFLMTKWDTNADPITNPLFGQLSDNDVSEVLDRQYPDAWPAFQAMPRSLRNDRRYFMQYCAGYLVEEANRPPPSTLKSLFDRYPRTLLNWLYENATRTGTNDGNRTRARVLFDDVIDKNAVRVRYLERVTNFIFAR